MSGSSDTLRYRWIDSPVGDLLIAGGERGIRRIAFSTGTKPAEPDDRWREDPRAFGPLVDQLADYFAARRRAFDLRLDVVGSPFQRHVWGALQTIPYGETRSYGDIARVIGQRSASQAVGAAAAANPLPIVIPCHRVIGEDGNLTGFGGGLAVKQALLELECAPGLQRRLF